jgi:hypothetical protein
MVERGRGPRRRHQLDRELHADSGRGGYCAPKAGLSMLLECLRSSSPARACTRRRCTRASCARDDREEQGRAAVRDGPAAAAARIVQELPAAPATIDFPWQLATAARSGARCRASCATACSASRRAVVRRTDGGAASAAPASHDSRSPPHRRRRRSCSPGSRAASISSRSARARDGVAERVLLATLAAFAANAVIAFRLTAILASQGVV